MSHPATPRRKASYNGRVTVGLQTATSLVPDPDAIVRAFLSELRALERLEPHRDG